MPEEIIYSPSPLPALQDPVLGEWLHRELHILSGQIQAVLTNRLFPIHTVEAGAALDFVHINGTVQKVTLDQVATISFGIPDTLTEQQATIRLLLFQDGTGGRTLTWPGTVRWPGGAAPVHDTTADSLTVAEFITDNAGGDWWNILWQTGIR